MFTNAQGADRSFPRPSIGASLFARLIARRQMRRELAAMRALDDHLLSDIGITRAEAEEAQLPKWDAPDHWKA